MTLDSKLVHFYRLHRKHQMDTYRLDGLRVWSDKAQAYVSAGQHTGGGAAYQSHALAAYWSARRSIHFRADLAKRVKGIK